MTPSRPTSAEPAPGPLPIRPEPDAGRHRVLRGGPRLLRVWATALRILASYGTFQLGKRLRGRAWAAEALLRFNRANAHRALSTVMTVQGLFIKVGQLLSVLAGALPPEVRRPLEALQDRITPRPWEEVRNRLAGELDTPAESLDAPDGPFRHLDPVPLAAASLAQVHAATLRDGRRVAVKVQHAGIEELARSDLATMRRILKLVSLFTGARGLDEVFDEVRATIDDELDFVREAEHTEAIGARLAAEEGVSAPHVVHELSTARVLVTERIDGVKLTDRDALDRLADPPLDRRELAERLLHAYCRMIFEDGLYHADPHPGNFLLRTDRRTEENKAELVFLDFGAVGRITPEMREGIPRLVEAVLRHDRRLVLRALRQMGFVQRHHRLAAGEHPGAGEEVAQRVIDYVYSRFLDDFDWQSWRAGDLRFDADLKFEVMADLKALDLWVHDLTATFRAPREWILLLRTAALLLGVCTELDPEVKPLAVVRPYVERTVVGSGGDWLRLVRDAVKDWALAAISLPGDLRRVLDRAERGELAVEVHGLRESAELLHAGGRQLLWGLSALGTGALACLARWQGDAALAEPLAWATGGLVAALAGSLWRSRRLRRALRVSRLRPRAE